MKILTIALLICLLFSCTLLPEEEEWRSLRDAVYDFRVEFTKDEGIPLDSFTAEYIGEIYEDIDYDGPYRYCHVRFDYSFSSVDFIKTFYCYDNESRGWYY